MKQARTKTRPAGWLTLTVLAASCASVYADAGSSGPRAAPLPSGPRDAQEHAYRGGMIVERVRAFVENDALDEMINWGAGPADRPDIPPEQYKVPGDLGTTGIFTAIEPTDLELYRSHLPEPLTMPARPLVAFVFVDYNRGNPVTRYYEGMVMLKGVCPDGAETWAVMSMPVESRLMMDMGVAWGFPKYIADKMTLTEDGAVVLRDGKFAMSLEFTPGEWHKGSGAIVPAGGAYGINNMMVIHPRQVGSMPLRFTYGPISVQERTEGMVKIAVRSEDWWSGLVPEDAIVPGVYQRFVGFGDAVIKKIRP